MALSSGVESIKDETVAYNVVFGKMDDSCDFPEDPR
jgi:hypothetical protein